MRQQTILISVIAGSICSVLFLCAASIAQDVPVTQGESPQQPSVSPAGDAVTADQEQKKTFRQIVKEVRDNEKEINRLFGSIPIGFPQKQIEHMKRIEALKNSNNILKSQLEVAAFEAFGSDPKKNRGAAQVVFGTLLKKLEVTRANPEYDPQGALKIAEMMLQTDLTSEPVGPVRFEDVAYQAFLASYAVEDYARAELMVKKIEERGVQLQQSIRDELADAQEKWQRELMIRRLELNTDDSPARQAGNIRRRYRGGAVRKPRSANRWQLYQLG